MQLIQRKPTYITRLAIGAASLAVLSCLTFSSLLSHAPNVPDIQQSSLQGEWPSAWPSGHSGQASLLPGCAQIQREVTGVSVNARFEK